MDDLDDVLEEIRVDEPEPTDNEITMQELEALGVVVSLRKE